MSEISSQDTLVIDKISSNLFYLAIYNTLHIVNQTDVQINIATEEGIIVIGNNESTTIFMGENDRKLIRIQKVL